MALPAIRIGTTDYHAKLFACQLSRRHAGGSTEKLATSLADALVDLNPHQIDAALFAFQSPLSNGVILADEVGLGKTIEAGLVISQFWAERKRQILVITPANLRKQWLAELSDKFHLPCTILEGATYNPALRQDASANPFDRHAHEIVIVSIPFAAGKQDNLARLPWDLVVIDEAHRLRNANGKQAQRLKAALTGRKKLLLTATPLQNNTTELWGLTSLIDEHFFGELPAFKERYGGQLDQRTFADLRNRLQPLVQRTLRKDAREFISYTDRIALVEEFLPTPEEQALYEMVSEYLRRPNLLALPSGQRHLMTMVLRKLLASSTFAIAGALRTMANRLERDLTAFTVQPDGVEDELTEDYEALTDTRDEWESDNEIVPPRQPIGQEQRAAMRRELDELRAFAEQAELIVHNAKANALIKGLRRAFAQAEQLGAARKAIVFTESRRTQQYLYRVLSDDPEFADRLVLFDGANSDEKSKAIYAAWRQRYAGTDRLSGSRSADIRAAIVDYFRDSGEIMIATEAAAEGINLQFCSLVINYDLPWNPQRIEQRIGRCHRYGQQHDVVVVNFLNRENAADQRVYELLDEKFHLFSGVFGATDGVLGAIGSGVDIERRIADIYQSARTKEEIDRSFHQMQLEMFEEIDQRRNVTERKLFEHFDENVAERFRVRQRNMQASLDRVERTLMALTRHELRNHAEFSGDCSFTLLANPFLDDPAIRLGRYDLLPATGEQGNVSEHLYRPGHPLALHLIAEARNRPLPPAEVIFRYGDPRPRLSAIEGLIGSTGWLSAVNMAIEMEAGAEDHLLFAAYTDAGQQLDGDQIESLFRLAAAASRTVLLDAATHDRLATITAERRDDVMQELEQRIDEWMEGEQAKLDAWAEDRRTNLVGEIDKLEKEIRQLRRELRGYAGDLRRKQQLRVEIAQIERRRDDLEDRNRQRRREIDHEQEALLDQAYARINQSTAETPLFTIRWRLER